jgi:uncharacterized protein YdeI (YjbR/CyaY-like superfamily)
MKITQSITPITRAEWRRWLEKNSRAVAEIWMVFYKKHTGKSCIRYEDAVEEALCFGWIDGIVRRIDAQTYGRRFTPRRAGSEWSELNRRRARKMITDGKMTEAGMTLYRAGLTKPVTGVSPKPADTLVVPSYLKSALQKDNEARRNFAQLPPGYKRMAIRWIMAAKKDETRNRRVEEFVRLTATGKRIGLK